MEDRRARIVAHSLRTQGLSAHAATLLQPRSDPPPSCRRWRPSSPSRIFVVDTVTPLDIAIAVLYVAVVLLAMDFAGRSGILIVAAGCAALTVLSYVITHGQDPASGPFLRCLISLVAIAHHRRSCRAPPGHDRSAARAREPARPHARHDLRAQPRRRHHLLEPRGDRALRLAAASRRSGARPPSCCRRSSPCRSRRIMAELDAHRTLGGRAGAHHARRPARDGGQPLGPAARRPRPCRRRSWRPTTTSPSAAHGRGRPASRPQRACPRRARRHPGRAHRLDRPRGQPAAGRRRHQWRGLPALAGREVPDLGQARSSVEHMIRNGQRASEVVRRLRALSRKADPVLRAALAGRRRQRRGAAGRPRAARPSRDAWRERDRRSAAGAAATACSCSRS